MLETICPKCRTRYPLGTDHVCPKKAASAAASSHRLGPQDQSGELPSASKGRASSKKGVATKTADRSAGAAPVEPRTTKRGDGNGLRLKGKGTAKVHSAADEPSVGSRESGSLAAGVSTQREDRASPRQPKPAAVLQQAEAAAAHLAPKRGRGRPKSIKDMAAYKAEKQREYRARLKAEREGK